MPHKKNPDVFELIRGRSNLLTQLPSQIIALTGNLTTGYHRDFQLLKEVMFPAIEQLKACLDLSQYALKELKVKDDLLDDSRYNLLTTVEAVNALVLEGIPFRQAYQMVGQAVENKNFDYQGCIEHSHEGSIGNLCTKEIKSKWDKVKDLFD